MSDELTMRPAAENDLQRLSAFMHAQGQVRCSPEYLRHWYFHTPSGSASVIIGEQAGALVCMATTNDHHFISTTGKALVGMPQKVLTDASLRGKGIFGKLYWASEKACLARGVDLFLTVTNEASTPIFLGKFGYQRLPSPRMAILLPAIGNIPMLATDSQLNERRVQLTSVWGIEKSAKYLLWRYTQHPLREYVIAHIGTTAEELGWLFLKRIRKKGLPVMLLMDMVPAHAGAEHDLFRMARRLTLKHGCTALLCLQEEWMEPALRRTPSLERSSGFNWLVKGRDDAHTQQLLAQRFDLSFGDLDFF